MDAPADTTPDKCQPLGATGQFFRDAANPHLLAGMTLSDGTIAQRIANPDVSFGTRFDLYASILHAPDFTSAGSNFIHHATSTDGKAWAVEDPAALSPGTTWDTVVDAPSVAVNPDAPADHRYLMVYAGATGALMGHDAILAGSIGAAFSADGVTFTRAQDTPVLTGSAAYPAATAAALLDPEVVYVDGTYQLWFGSFACSGSACDVTSDVGVGHATSPDGVTWTVEAAPVKSLLRAAVDPTSGGGQPTVVYDAPHCRYEMWMAADAAGDVDAQPVDAGNTAGVWHATSTDAITWHASFTGGRDLAWQAAPGEHLGMQAGADVTIDGTGRVMTYIGFDDQNLPAGATLPARAGGTTPGVTALDVATRDL